jgi:hypothetical protein
MSSMNSVVMEMLMGGMVPGAASPALLTDRLGELARNDSRMAPLVRHLQERLAARNSEVEPPLEGSAFAPAEPQIVEPVQDSPQSEELKSVVKRMFAELQRLRSRLGMLADALGACPQCWGEGAGCEYCGGEGQIGSYLINPKVFERVVGPALVQLRQRPPLVQQKNITQKGEGNHAVR